jgi:hypothetical protein
LEVGRDVRYFSNAARMIEGPPAKNSIILEVSSELRSTNYNEIILYLQNGNEAIATDKIFKTTKYKFLPDNRNKTKNMHVKI